jgi:hypothetical protein
VTFTLTYILLSSEHGASSAKKGKAIRAEAWDMAYRVHRLCKQEPEKRIRTVLALQGQKAPNNPARRQGHKAGTSSTLRWSYFNTPELGTATSQTKTLTSLA